EGLFHRMNNEQKNTYVKKQITAALLALLEEKPLSDISVSELTSKAGTGRVSFYRNYQSKEDILKEESDRLIKEWGRLYESNPESAPETLFPSLFDFYRDHRDFYMILYNAGMSFIMMKTILSTIRITPEMQNLEAYIKSFWAYGIYGWLLEWIKRGMPESGKELSTLFSLARQNQDTPDHLH
ncbi:MAG: TetR/AcrR family transcriptional regulator, partial [Solobacterium sp.]|nr:TetR/AcrR family transcriptional regulator [Solobacterium sp.]